MPPSANDPDDTLNGDGEKPYRVEFHRDVAAIFKKHYDNKRFRPSLLDLLARIETNPKQYPQKQGKLKDHLAAKLRYAAVEWRLVFRVDEENRVVYVQALDKHDEAYKQAERRA